MTSRYSRAVTGYTATLTAKQLAAVRKEMARDAQLRNDLDRDL